MNESNDVNKKKLTLGGSCLESKLKLTNKLSIDYSGSRGLTGKKTVTTIEIRKSKKKGNISEIGSVLHQEPESLDFNTSSEVLTQKEYEYRVNAVKLKNTIVAANKNDLSHNLTDVNTSDQEDFPISNTEESNDFSENIVTEAVSSTDSDKITQVDHKEEAQQESVLTDDNTSKSTSNTVEIKSTLENEVKKLKTSDKEYEQKDHEHKKDFKKSSSKSNYSKYDKVIIDIDDGDTSFTPKPRTKQKHHKKNFNISKNKISRKVILPDKITIQELSNRMSERYQNVLKYLSKLGKFTSSDYITADMAIDVIQHFNHTFKRISESDIEDSLYKEIYDSKDKVVRAPVVTIMGHVDHGKTSLLDAIRSTNVVSTEAGQITQHIGAYQITNADGKKITFIDTPGHEAFTSMRARGANITDIVVLIIAADDGIMMQTVEAINHAKSANVPIIVAINKIDKPDVNIDRIKNSLLQYDIIPEDMGGDTIVVPISAKSKINIDLLEESILLIAELLDLKTSVNCRACGVVIESKIDKQRGNITTVIVQEGTLKVGDIVTVGNTYGKIRAMFNDMGKNEKTASLSMPVEILGLNAAPNAGDKFIVVNSEKQAREIINSRTINNTQLQSVDNNNVQQYLFDLASMPAEQFNIILKCDVMGSVEAISDSLSKLTHDEVKSNIIHKAVGNITDSDIILAEASNAEIIAFNVKADAKIRELAKQKNVKIHYYSIIYELIDYVKDSLNGMLKPITKEISIGSVVVKQVFSVTKNSAVLGCYVTDGLIKRGSHIKLLRNGNVIYEGELKALRRFKDDVKEVKANFECGIQINTTDVQQNDVIQVFDLVEESRNI